MGFKKIEAKDLGNDPFSLFRKAAVVYVKGQDRDNALTVAWGGLGVLYGKDVVFLFIRNSRFSHHLFKQGNLFSVNFFDMDEYKEPVLRMGKTSGKDLDKIKESGWHLCQMDESESAFFKEAKLVITAKKLNEADLASVSISDKGLAEKIYGGTGDYHTLFVGEITSVYQAG